MKDDNTIGICSGRKLAELTKAKLNNRTGEGNIVFIHNGYCVSNASAFGSRFLRSCDFGGSFFGSGYFFGSCGFLGRSFLGDFCELNSQLGGVSRKGVRGFTGVTVDGYFYGVVIGIKQECYNTVRTRGSGESAKVTNAHLNSCAGDGAVVFIHNSYFVGDTCILGSGLFGKCYHRGGYLGSGYLCCFVACFGRCYVYVYINVTTCNKAGQNKHRHKHKD